MKSTAALNYKLNELELETNGNAVETLVQEIGALKQKLESQAEVIQDLKRQAMEDPMTKVANRRAFEKELNRALSYFKRYNRQGALLMIDLDAFKSINDSLGHLAGDAILKHVASLLKTHTRDSDFVARLGGDEFCIILREIAPHKLAKKAREIAEVIAATPCSYEGREIYASVSVGGCNFHQADSRSDLMEKADKAMYRQKGDSSSTRA